MGKDISVAIIGIGPEENRGGYTMHDVKCKKLDTGEFITVTVFTHDKDFTFVKGDEVLMPVKTKDWKGKTQYSASLDKIEPIKINSKKDNGMTQEGWEKKEARERRGRAIMYALETIKMSKVDTKDLETTELENLVCMSADNYLTYIYDGKKPLPIDDCISSET